MLKAVEIINVSVLGSVLGSLWKSVKMGGLLHHDMNLDIHTLLPYC